MPKYLVRASLSAEAIRGTLQEGGTKRKAAVEALAESLGARVEAFCYAFGEDDLYVFLEAPDNVSMATASMVVSAAGTGRVHVVVLLTPEEMDRCAQQGARYRPPGG